MHLVSHLDASFIHKVCCVELVVVMKPDKTLDHQMLHISLVSGHWSPWPLHPRLAGRAHDGSSDGSAPGKHLVRL